MQHSGRKSIGPLLREIRKYRGFSLAELAKKANVSKGYLSDIEKEKKVNVSEDFLLKIANQLDVTSDYFFENRYVSITAAVKIETLKRCAYKYYVQTNKLKQLKEACSHGGGFDTTENWALFFKTLKLIEKDRKILKVVNQLELKF